MSASRSWGGERPIEAIRAQWPKVRTISRPRLRDCVLSYLAIGWTGRMPPACHDAVIYVPINYAALLWGWPGRFLELTAAANSEVFVVGPYTSQSANGATGLDRLEDLALLPADFAGGIMTDRIEVVGAALRPP